MGLPCVLPSWHHLTVIKFLDILLRSWNKAKMEESIWLNQEYERDREAIISVYRLICDQQAELLTMLAWKKSNF